MSTDPKYLTVSVEQAEQIADALSTQGYVVLDNPLPQALILQLAQRCLARSEQEFKQAGIGHAQDFKIQPEVRSDRICWLDGNDIAERAYLNFLHSLRLAINQRLFLGLFEVEAHFAHYTPGAFYQKHVDAFRGNSNRKLSSVLYLNPDWRAEDGGELLLYADDQQAPIERVLPHQGRLILFLSEGFPHEVLPAQRHRYSIAGWFRVSR